MTSANVADQLLTQSDEVLLARFLDTRDEAAFAGLVERHGRTVWAVCRRFLERKEDLEDAFQAVFFVLARKAATIRKGEVVGSWLYGVACRTAMKARRTALRRDVHEKRAAKPAPEQAPSSEMVSRELQRALDEEVQRLGEKYKAAFVLCFLEGMSRADAARTLGLTESTLAGRLARARTQLQKRLGQRGITLTAALTAVAMAQSAAVAAVPEGLAPGAVNTALALDGTETHALSPAAHALAAHVMRGMMLPRLAVGAAVLVLISLLVGGTSLAAFVQWDLSPAGPGNVNAPPVKIAKVRVTALKVEKQAKAGTKVGRVEPVKALVYSPDGKKLITVGHHDNEMSHLKIWDLTNDKELLAQFEIPPAVALAFAPDGKSVACGEATGDIKLRDPNTGAEQSALKGHSLSVQSVAFSPDGHSLVSGGLDGVARFWNLAEKREQHAMRGHAGGIHAVAFFADGRTFVTGGADHTAKVWDIDGGKEVTLVGHSGAVESVAVSADNKIIATASRDKTIRLWDASTGKETAVLEGDAPFHAVAFSPDGKILAGTAGKSIHLWDTKTQEPIGGLEKQAAPIRALAFSPGGNGLANGSALGLVLLTMQVTQDEAWQEQVLSFKGKAECPPGWELKGDEAERCVRFEPEGLRITVPPGNSPSGRGQGKGLASYQTVKGDFEITVSFDILQEPEPMDAGSQGKATRFSLEIILDKLKPLRNMASITRKVANAGATYNAWSVLHDEDATPPETVRSGGTTTSAKTGRLRLSRSGANLSFAVADGLDGEFTLLRQFPFGRENLREVRVVAATGGPKAAIDVRVIDLRIRAESLSDLPQPPIAPAVQVIGERQSGSRWMPATIVVVVGSATLLGLFLIALRMRRVSPQSITAASQTKPQPERGANVSIACPTCGKPLRVKGTPAGKKLKCPHCGATFQVDHSDTKDRWT